MEPARRAKYLSALGIVQYRRRSLVVETSKKSTQETLIAEAEIDSVNNDVRAGAKEVANKASEVFKVSDAKHDLVQELEQVKADLIEDSPGPHGDKPAFGFDLLVWRSSGVLVLEFSVVESEDLELKHRLVNNILKALWPQEFQGVEVHQHTWPMQGVAADITSATEWLGSLVSGHLQHESKAGNEGARVPLWIMGEQGLKMLFPDLVVSSKDLSELMGTQKRHEQLGVDLLISQGLKQISESAVAKAQVWQLLKPLRQAATD